MQRCGGVVWIRWIGVDGLVVVVLFQVGVHEVGVACVLLVRGVRPGSMRGCWLQEGGCAESVMIVEAVRVRFVVDRRRGTTGAWLGVRQEDLSFFAGGTVASTGHHYACAAVFGAVGIDTALGSVHVEGVICSLVVAGIHRASLPADEEPAETATNRSDEVHWVQGVEYAFNAEGTALIAAFAVAVEVGDLGRLVLERILFPGKCPQVKDGKEGHLNIDE